MASTLLPDDVDRIATLARLTLSAEERERFVRQLNDVLHYVEQVQQVETAGIAATSHPLVAETAWREDAPRPSLPTRAALANAPDANRDAGLFRVPKVIEG
jgi:aspartyl-tRNA(Asn)/glutamyl-tRNA(Gln) amidotransferase subunit C